jgi:hypothetical protein
MTTPTAEEPPAPTPWWGWFRYPGRNWQRAVTSDGYADAWILLAAHLHRNTAVERAVLPAGVGPDERRR